MAARQVSGVSVGVVGFAAVPAADGQALPIASGTLVWSLGQALGISVIVKATLSLVSRTPVVVTSEPLHLEEVLDASGVVTAPADLVPRRNLVDVLASGRVRADGPVRFLLQQTSATGFDLSRPARKGEPGGFGPVRRPLPQGLLARSAAGMLSLALPVDFDWLAFQAAPPAQRLTVLDPDARFIVDGLGGERIDAQLPGVRAVGTAFGPGPQPRPLAFRADTLLIEVERLRCHVVWRAELPLARLEDLPAITIAAGVATAASALVAPASAPNYEATTILPDAAASAPAPKQPGVDRLAAWQAALAVGGDRTAPLASKPEPPLPFKEGQAKPPPPAAKIARGKDKGGTVSTGGKGESQTLPFKSSRARAVEEARRLEAERKGDRGPKKR